MSTASDIGLTVKNILKVGGGAVLASILTLAVYGSVISQGQFICDSNKNPNCGLVSGTRGVFIPGVATSAITGSVKVGAGATAGARWSTLSGSSPFSSGA